MKKSTSKASLVHAGGGVWVQKKSSRQVPNNKGLSYFKWTMETTMVLLNECLSKEVWAKEYGDVTRTWADIAIILKNIPAWEGAFTNLKGTHCQKEYNRNLALYRQDENAASFKSGSAESHRTWHDLMGEIVTLSGDIDILGHDESVAPDDVHEPYAHVNLQKRAADLAKAGS